MSADVSCCARAVRATVAFALTTSVSTAADQPVLDHIVVTATRAATSLSHVGDSVTVITAAEARASQKTTVADLLSTTPGVTLSRNGGLGSTTAVRIRGAESDHTVVLIDGIKVNDPSSTGGGFDFGNLLTNDIARIEVLRGSQSVLWGSQAIGGVINIVTHDPSGPLSAAIDAEAGSHATARLAARTEAGTDRYGWRVGGHYVTTDGVSAFDRDLGGREDDGFRNIGGNVRGHINVTDNLIAELRSVWWRGRNDFDGFPPPAFTFADTREYGTTEQWINYAGVRISTLNDRLQHRIGVAHTSIERENIDPTSVVETTFAAEGSNVRYEYQGTLTLNERWSAVFGAERERSDFSSASPSEFDPRPTPITNDVTLDSLYGLIQFSPIETLTLAGGARHDDHETFGDDTSAQVSAAWSASDATTLRASFGQAFKAPTLYQLYSDYGTLNLAPEHSEDWDVGIEQRLLAGRVGLSVTYFQRDTRNMIDFVSCFGVMTDRCSAQPFGYYENVQRTTADGVELALDARLGSRLTFSANYTDMDARNDARGTTNFGLELPRRARETGYAALSYEWAIPLTTSIAAQYVGASYDNAANTFELDSYTLLDLRANYQLSDSMEVYGRIENATDEAYQTTRRYGSLGRSAYLGVRVTW
jgi:vitamin B12 transporter